MENLAFVFSLCKNVLSSDGTLWVVINDVRKSNSKQNIPHELATLLSRIGYMFLDDLVWYKKNHIANGSSKNFTQAYEYILVFSKIVNNRIAGVMNRIDRFLRLSKYLQKHIMVKNITQIFPEDLVNK